MFLVLIGFQVYYFYLAGTHGHGHEASEVANPSFSSCVRNSNYNFTEWQPYTNYTWSVMSTIQIEETQPSGFASRCDWVIGSRPVGWNRLPKNTAWGTPEKLPKTVFVQTEGLQQFNDKLLPCFPANHRFVLIIGDHDGTTPKQLDARYAASYITEKDWQAWLKDSRIAHLFVENLDTISPRKRVTPIPLGLNPDDHWINNKMDPDQLFFSAPTTVNITAKPIRVAFTNRIRTNSRQWADRALAMQICSELPHCDVHANLTRISFIETIQKYPFLLCIHGGGIDPNPNLFTALLAGVIPIIAPFPGDFMYSGMPVMFIDANWNRLGTTLLSPKHLAEKKNELSVYFEDAEKRAEVLNKLSSQYWWNQVEAHLKEG